MTLTLASHIFSFCVYKSKHDKIQQTIQIKYNTLTKENEKNINYKYEDYNLS